MFQTMKPSILLPLLVLFFATGLNAQTPYFTYQGRLTDNGAPANGLFDFEFTPYTAAQGGIGLGSFFVSDVGVTNGLFTVQVGVAFFFDGTPRWLQVAVRPGDSTGAYTPLSPRQEITSAPYAAKAGFATVASYSDNAAPDSVRSNSIVDAAVTGPKLADGAVTSAKIADNSINATDVNASSFNTTFWQTGGNVGTTPGTHFLGTTDAMPLELRVGGERSLRLERSFAGVPPNVIGGWKDNLVSSGRSGSVIAGGGNSSYTNRIDADVAAVGGGAGNWIQNNANQSVIAGGFNNQIQAGAYSSVIAGGGNNRIATNAHSSAILGGESNWVNPDAPYSSVLGGRANTAGAAYALAGGRQARALHQGAFVWADSSGLGFSSTASNQFLIRASGGVGINTNNPGSAALAVNGDTQVSGGLSANALEAASALTVGITATVGADIVAGRDITAGRNVLMGGKAGIGTANPQGTLHVYSASSPTTIRLQSSAQPGAGRIEFLSDPQGSASEWRPGYIQSTDNGGFTGGLAFVVNGSGVSNRFGAVETMRVVNGRVGIGNNAPSTLLQVGNATCNGTTWNNASDRNLKENLKPVNAQVMLEKVIALPLSEWNYKATPGESHVGPMAQDFKAAFGLGADDKSIATVDADGVALAAIQGLNEKVENHEHKAERRLARLAAENAELRAELATIKLLLKQFPKLRD